MVALCVTNEGYWDKEENTRKKKEQWGGAQNPLLFGLWKREL
jgi:hypothetical protein